MLVVICDLVVTKQEAHTWDCEANNTIPDYWIFV